MQASNRIASSGRKRKTLRFKEEKESVWTQGQIGHENNICTKLSCVLRWGYPRARPWISRHTKEIGYC